MLWTNGKAKELDDELDEETEEESNVMIPGAVAPAAIPARASCMISAGTVITGDMTSEDDVTIAGSLKGNLTAKGAVHISGMVKGDVSAESITLEGGTIEGNVTASGLAQLERDGKVHGNVKAKDVRIKIGATVVGDITAESNAMEAGAVLQGKLNIGNVAPAKPAKAAAPAEEKPAATV